MKGICPICKRYKKLINYHIFYDPEVIIMACQSCNYLEYRLRKCPEKISYKKKGIEKRVKNIINLRFFWDEKMRKSVKSV